MTIAGDITHFLLKYVLNYFILFILCVFLLDIPYEKMPMLLLAILIAGVGSYVLASLLMRGS